MLGIRFPTKKALKSSVGKDARFLDYAIETSLFGPEIKGGPATYTVVGPDPYRKRSYYANVTVNADGVITRVT